LPKQNSFSMRRLLLLLFVLIAFRGNSQQNRFAYFQAAANQPFYIRMDEKTLSSNSFGSLVISKLKDSTYKLYIGLPGNKSSEQLFEVPISGSDRGFELKLVADGSLRLLDWQKMNYIEPVVRQVKPVEAPTQAKTDTYSKLMAAVVDDPVVATITIQVPVQSVSASAETATVSSKMVTEPVSVAADSTPGIVKENTESQKLDTIRPVKQEITLPASNPSAAPVVTAVTSAPTVDSMKTGKDTSKLSATPNDQAVHTGSEPIPTAAPKEQTPSISSLSDTVREKYRELVFVDRSSNLNDTVDIRIALDPPDAQPVDSALYRVKETKPDTTKATTSVQLINSDCTKFATDADVDKLRVAILNANSNDTKVVEAKKIFKSRCFSTKQIRALSELFSSDDGRYKLFDAAFPFISDSSNFKNLVDLLEDSFYINRFKTLARIQD
jgi:hypothetical protein